MPGYDTLKILLPKSEIKTCSYFSEVPKILTNVADYIPRSSHKHSVLGNFKNFRIRLNDNGISITGSISRYYNGTNLHTLDIKKAREAISKLSDELHLPIKKGIIRRLDVAENFQMINEPSFYYPMLGETFNYRRLEQNNGIEYRQGKKRPGHKGMVFYDKIIQHRNCEELIPVELKNKYLLRYELRFLNRLREQFKMPEINVSNIFTEVFYRKVTDIYQSEYFKIKKIRQMNNSFGKCSNVKQLQKQLLLSGIEKEGGELIVLQNIERLRKENKLNKMQTNRLKNKVKSLCNTAQLTFESEAILELDKKVMDCAITRKA